MDERILVNGSQMSTTFWKTSVTMMKGISGRIPKTSSLGIW